MVLILFIGRERLHTCNSLMGRRGIQHISIIGRVVQHISFKEVGGDKN